MREKKKIIVTGLIAQFPLGGVSWDYIQYVLGFKDLGHDVYYLEDTDQWPFNPSEGGVAKDCVYNVDYLNNLMSVFGLKDKWAYKFPYKSQWFGLPDEKRQEVVGTADILINVSGTLAHPEEYRAVKKMIYIDSDPVFTQIKLLQNQSYIKKLIDVHDIHFTFGETLDLDFFNTGHSWLPTRQPVILDEWKNDNEHKNNFTTIMNWTSYRDVVYKDETYGQKDSEFVKFMDLPKLIGNESVELAVNIGKTRKTPKRLLLEKGWKVVDPNQVCPDFSSYRNYIQESKGEWSIAKNGYIKGKTGWFSCRSACYLAAGRPTVLQDTGFSKIIPSGEGLFAFNTLEEAVKAVKEVSENYKYHKESARRIAEEYFDSKKVLNKMLADIF